MNHQSMTLNIRYDAPQEIWDKLSMVYAQLDGWMGDGGLPYWFGFDENEKHISASVEPGGILFNGHMNDNEWAIWCKKIKEVATKELGYKIGEMELGEVDDSDTIHL